MTTTTMF